MFVHVVQLSATGDYLNASQKLVYQTIFTIKQTGLQHVLSISTAHVNITTESTNACWLQSVSLLNLLCSCCSYYFLLSCPALYALACRLTLPGYVTWLFFSLKWLISANSLRNWRASKPTNSNYNLLQACYCHAAFICSRYKVIL
jgi:hypothetical protein